MGLFKQYIYLASSNTMQSFIALITRIFYARYLGPSDYGIFGVGLNAINIFTKSCSLGIVPSAQYHASKGAIQRPLLLMTLLSIGSVLSLIGLLGIFFFKILGSSLLTHCLSGGYQVFLTFGYFLPVLMIGSMLCIVLIPWFSALEYSFVSLMAGVTIPVSFLILSRSGNPLFSAIVSQIVSWVVILLLSLYLVRHYFIRSRFDSHLCKSILSFGLQAWPHAILTIGGSRLAVLLGATVLVPDQLGIFVVAANISEAVFSFHTGLGQLILTRVSALECHSFKTIQEAMRLTVLTLLCLALIYLFVGKQLLLLFFGSSYEESWGISLIMIIAGVCHVLSRLLGNFLAGMGQPIRNAVTNGIEILGIVITIPYFGSIYGLLGVSWAAAISATAGLTVASIQSMLLMSCNFTQLFLPKPSDIIALFKLIRQSASLVAKALFALIYGKGSKN